MCGRFTLTATPEEVEAMFSLLDLEPFPPRYNIAPTQPIAIVADGPAQAPGSNLPRRRALLVRWGLIPAWAKNPKDLPLFINARAETAAEKAAFRAAMRHRRVLVPASGFYEWRRVGKARPQPFFVRPKGGGLIAFAGLMETYLDAGGSEIDTAAILTTAANDDIRAIHERMPVVIRPEHFDRWLNCRSQEPRDVADLLAPLENGILEAIPVSDAVNKVDNTGPEIQERIADRQDAEPTAAKVEEPRSPQLNLF